MPRLPPRVVAALAGSGAMAIAATFIDVHEGLELQAYQDGAKVWTICRGHTKGVKPGMRATVDECDRLFAADLAQTFAEVDGLVSVPMSDPRRAAVASFVYNFGAAKFSDSRLRRKLNAGDASACGEFLRWRYMAGFDCSAKGNTVCAGLWTRRQQEYQLCQR
ncbi:lysozyme [Ferrovibrio terrae]|uniref:lysozyme n=1 Tax=Ferrovibrio terrae TaxID=2594003 RepID=UPI003137AAF2